MSFSDGKLNQDQEKAAEGFFNFLFSDDREFILSGPAGVGKTYLLGKLIDNVIPRYHESCALFGTDPIYNQIMMTATTNKAAEVLGRAIKRPTKTVHSFFNLRIQNNYADGSVKLVRTPRWTVHENYIIVVDESGMVDHSLRKHILEGTHKSKIVYVGDHCQLGPVKETISPIYQDNLHFYELTQQMRTDNPVLQAVNAQLRETVETKVFKPIKVVPGVVDWLNDGQMAQALEDHFMEPSNNNRILAYRNRRVIEYNDHIRLMRGYPDLLQPGERVINNNAVIYRNNETIPVEAELTIVNVNPNTTMVQIEPGVELEVMGCSAHSPHRFYEQLFVPVDKEHHTALIKYYAKKKDWAKYFHLKERYPDLRPMDASTVHKAQGSTYDTVFIDMADLSLCRDKDTAARLLYVAFSRARKRVVMYGDLAPKFGGIVT